MFALFQTFCVQAELGVNWVNGFHTYRCLPLKESQYNVFFVVCIYIYILDRTLFYFNMTVSLCIRQG